MPLVWRLTAPAFARKLDGEGNRRHGARWNSPGRGVVYTSVNLSLCVLEVLAHLPAELRSRIPPMAAVALDMPDVETETISREEMSRHESDRAQWCRAKGDAWLRTGRTLALSAPSVIVPQERNIMLNPLHADMALIAIVSMEEFRFDGRLVRESV
jgi:RES domain-containing protein